MRAVVIFVSFTSAGGKNGTLAWHKILMSIREYILLTLFDARPMNKVVRDSGTHYLSCRNPISFVGQFGIYLYVFRVMLSGCWAGSKSWAIQLFGTPMSMCYHFFISLLKFATWAFLSRQGLKYSKLAWCTICFQFLFCSL